MGKCGRLLRFVLVNTDWKSLMHIRLVVTDAGNFISVLIAKGDSESDIPNVADLEQLNGVYVVYDKTGNKRMIRVRWLHLHLK